MKQLIRNMLRHFGYELRSTGSGIRDVFALQRALIGKKGPVIFDVGAHVGTVTRKYRELFPLALIHCFEPFPLSYEQLRKNMEGDSRTRCHRIALSDRKGMAVLHANVASDTNSLLATDPKASAYWGPGLLDTTSQVAVDTTTIDDVVHENEIAHIDILKLDVQGAEFAVFEGAAQTLSSQKVSLIYTELIMCPTYEGQRSLDEYLRLLGSYGYEFLDFFNPVLGGKQVMQADVVFLSAALKKMRVAARPPGAQS